MRVIFLKWKKVFCFFPRVVKDYYTQEDRFVCCQYVYRRYNKSRFGLDNGYQYTFRVPPEYDI